MDLRKLRHAVALANHLNFTRAAEALNLTQSALSRSIQALEQECQLRLFDRNRNAVAITPAGREFVRHARGLLQKQAELKDMVDHAARGDGGSIALGMAPLAARILMPPLMGEMVGRPGFHATVTIGTPGKLLPMLMDESLHICVCTGSDAGIPGLVASVPLGKFPISVLVRAGHPLTTLGAIEPEDLDAYPLLRTRHFETDEDIAGPRDGIAQRRPVLTIEDYDVLTRIAAQSDAIWITSPLSAREALVDGTLVQIPISWLEHSPHAHMTAYYLRNRTLLPIAERILDRLAGVSRDVLRK